MPQLHLRRPYQNKLLSNAPQNKGKRLSYNNEQFRPKHCSFSLNKPQLNDLNINRTKLKAWHVHFNCSFYSLVFLKCLSVTWSMGKKLTVALYSGHILAMVVRSGADSWETPGPKNSTNFPEIPACRKCWENKRSERQTRSSEHCYLEHLKLLWLNDPIKEPLWCRGRCQWRWPAGWWSPPVYNPPPEVGSATPVGPASPLQTRFLQRLEKIVKPVTDDAV